MRTRLLLLLLLVTAVTADVAASAPAGDSATRPTLTVKSSRFGPILFDGRGYVLYVDEFGGLWLVVRGNGKLVC